VSADDGADDGGGDRWNENLHVDDNDGLGFVAP
jgi:hypothetical protein